MRLRAALLALCVAGVALADETPEHSARIAAVETRWDAWLESAGAPDAVLVLLHEGASIATFERGLSAQTPVDLASTSKAITAQCIARLVAEGRLSYETPLSDHLRTPKRFTRAGTTTVAELLTHTGGLAPDQTQGPMSDWRRDPQPRWAEVGTRALNRWSQDGTRGTHAYNNENYALLGALVEAVTGQDYLTACVTRVLTPLGLTARLSLVTGGYGPWGGLAMTPSDYATFHAATWPGTDPRLTPHVDLGGGVYYGLGMVSRVTKALGAHFWHFGLLCFDDQDDHGTFTVSWGTGWSAFAAYRRCTTWEQMVALDQALIGGVFSDP